MTSTLNSSSTVKSSNSVKPNSIQSVERAAAVLDVIAAHPTHGCRLADIVNETELGRATAHRFLRALQGLGFIDLDEATGRYFVGIRIVALGLSSANRFGIERLARNSMLRLAQRSEDTVYLFLRSDSEAVCIAREEGNFPIKTLTQDVGDRRPLGVGAAALALLAFLEPEEIERVLDANASNLSNYGTDRSTITRLVKHSRELGYALNDDCFVPGMSAVGVPIYVEGRAVASLGVAAITTRMTPDRREMIAGWIKEETDKIEKALLPLHQSGMMKI